GLGRLLLAGRRCVRRGLRLACGGGRRGLRRPEVRLGGRFDGQRSPAPARARRRGLVGPGLVGLTRRGGVLLGGGAGGGRGGELLEREGGPPAARSSRRGRAALRVVGGGAVGRGGRRRRRGRRGRRGGGGRALGRARSTGPRRGGRRGPPLRGGPRPIGARGGRGGLPADPRALRIRPPERGVAIASRLVRREGGGLRTSSRLLVSAGPTAPAGWVRGGVRHALHPRITSPHLHASACERVVEVPRRESVSWRYAPDPHPVDRPHVRRLLLPAPPLRGHLALRRR